MAHVIVETEPLAATCRALLAGLGVPAEDAALTADVFVDSDLRGEASHGMRLLVQVLGRIAAGSALAKPRVTVLADRGAIAVFDAHHSLGQVVAARAMRLAIAKARQHGVGIVGVRNDNSYTSAKYYPLMAAAEDMIGITYTNSCAMMPPPGGMTPTVGNNPVAIAAPTGGEHPFVLDMAVAVAMEKIRQARELGEPIPEGWALDVEGRPTTDPAAALESGIVLPFGGYKSFGLGMAHEMLTSVLMDGHLFTAGALGFVPYDGPMNVSHFIQAIDISFFGPVDAFKRRMDAMIAKIKSSRLAPGSHEVLLPGERGYRERARRLVEGIPVPEPVFEDLRDWARKLGVPPIDRKA